MEIEKIKALPKGVQKKKILLFSGLFLLVFSGVGLLTGLPPVVCYILLGSGILMKVLFLAEIFRAPDFRMSAELYLILTGVGLILLSLIFKSLYPFPLLRTILFYTAITLKVSGVALLLFRKKR